MTEPFREFIKKHAKVVVYCLLVLAAGCATLLYRLGSLTQGFGPSEITTLKQSLSAHDLLNNPLNLPLTALQWIALHIDRHHYAFARLPSAMFGVAALVCIAYILQRWYGQRATVLGLILVASSSWFLHVSRSASPDILYFAAMPALLSSHVMLRENPDKFLVRLVWLGVHIACLFVPGLMWLALLNAGLQYKFVLQTLAHPGSWWKITVLALMLLLGIGSLTAALIRDPSLIRVWLGLPAHFGGLKVHYVRLVQSVSYFVARGPQAPSMWLGRLPILDAVASLMLICGAFFYGKHLRAPRTQLLATMFVVGTALFSLNGAVSFSIMVPVIYIVATAGIAYLLHTWLKVFPRNPLARGLGMGVVFIAIGLSVTYNIRSYFVAWPKNNETRAVMTHRPPVRVPVKH